jgi:hypothetical protein
MSVLSLILRRTIVFHICEWKGQHRAVAATRRDNVQCAALAPISRKASHASMPGKDARYCWVVCHEQLLSAACIWAIDLSRLTVGARPATDMLSAMKQISAHQSRMRQACMSIGNPPRQVPPIGRLWPRRPLPCLLLRDSPTPGIFASLFCTMMPLVRTLLLHPAPFSTPNSARPS